MKIISAIAASLALAFAAPAFAAPVSMTFQNVGIASMTVSRVNACGVFAPAPDTVLAGATSQTSSTDCGSAASAAHVTYNTKLR